MPEPLKNILNEDLSTDEFIDQVINLRKLDTDRARKTRKGHEEARSITKAQIFDFIMNQYLANLLGPVEERPDFRPMPGRTRNQNFGPNPTKDRMPIQMNSVLGDPGISTDSPLYNEFLNSILGNRA